MVKFTLTALALAAASLPFSLADNCTPHIQYCGFNLLEKGNYFAQINTALSAANQPTDQAHVNSGLFWCTGGPNGEITFRSFCQSGCHDGGSGYSDWCN
ncbi:hypothetical protein F1880_002347 [Penicillium rolfsii]|nr:hypothetical protein F1880_002347 [Penicillium rolfsii]